ncbi:hypothetical protein SAMN05192549_107421 [Duganella sacchari]|uniref:Haem-binding uptake, Tiki superfamily, ChaN n=1 Tax=Duganella sacchari TaxID=551987 RepID=A0A1M7QQQ4_9BURK|nr:DUF5694 domain-containing protein [Duganella sacchari]SHN33684.1 hypothetical protein SAMN05192549_107421 [Duganella sacchari]
MKKWAVWMLLAVPFAAQARLDLTTLDKNMAGPRSKVLVLGTMHLNSMPAGFNPAVLDRVLDRLAAYQPDIITIEALPGEECDLAARQPAKYGADYCPPTDTAAIAEMNRMFKTWPSQPSPDQRRHLAAVMLAANEPASAYVQWLQLPEAERKTGDGLTPALIDKLKEISVRNNEDYQIAARLAARLGLQRVHPVDNHTGDNISLPDEKAFGKSIEAAWASDRAALNQREKQEAVLRQSTDYLPLYRYLNEPESLRIYAEANIVPALRAKSAEGYPQIWVAGWEVRNLRMVANIRETFREKPGARVLSIVGLSHKPWFDSLLGQLQGVDMVDAAAILK